MTVATGTSVGDAEIYVDEEQDPPIFYCAAVVYRGSYYEPTEYCENEVTPDEEYCDNHNTEEEDYYDPTEY